jgi:hypothetical protein
VGKLLPGGRYQADDGFVYPNYQSAANRGMGWQTIQKAGSSLLQGLSNPSALINQSLGYLNQYEAARNRGFGGGRSASAMEAPNPKTQLITSGDADLGGDPGRMFDVDRRGDVDRTLPLPGGRGRVQITSPNTTFQNADDEYNRLKSQFGGTTGVSQLAGMASLPTGFTPTGGKQAAGLKDYYAAQQEVGERNIGNITESLAYKDSRYQKGGKLEQWAKANPMLAMREFNKLGYQTSAEMQGPSDQQKIRDAISGGTYYPAEGSPSPVTNPPDFGTPANKVPGTWDTQGLNVSIPYREANQVAAQKTAGATGMPNFQTTPEAQDPGKNFLSNKLSSPWMQAVFNTVGAMGIDYLQGTRR